MADAGDGPVGEVGDRMVGDQPNLAEVAPAPRPKRQWNPPGVAPMAEAKRIVVEPLPPVEVAPRPAPVVVEPVSVPVAAVEPPAPAEPVAPVAAAEPVAPVEPVRTPRTAPVSSEPVLERIVVGDNAAATTEPPKPTKRGWWSKT
jgi:hypothetical protein